MRTKTIPYDPKANQLLLRGAEALSRVESNGMAIDTEYLSRTMDKVRADMAVITVRMESSDVAQVWRQTFGTKTNLNSAPQLGVVLFDKMGLKHSGRTEKSKRYKTDEGSLVGVDHPFVKDYLEIANLKKVNGTYLKGILREVVDGMLHNFFNLHTVISYRSSSSSLNFQNVPIRDPIQGEIVRKAFVPRPGRRLVEIDFSGAEIRTLSAYTQDLVLVDYIMNPNLDMHRDLAMDCYMLPEDEVSKAIRHVGKNQFVFPTFYGSYYKNIAPAMWSSRLELKTKSGLPLDAHLQNVGLVTEEKFTRRLEAVERRFWGTFNTSAGWKDDWVAKYNSQGYIKMLTGFICFGPIDRTKIINYGVQGSSFHHLLWVLNNLILEELPEKGMDTIVIGQIHDSLVSDVPAGELDGYLTLIRKLLNRLRRQWATWLPVPMEAECKVSALREDGGNWWEMTEQKL